MMRFIQSFGFAWNGIRIALHSERNFRVQLIIALGYAVLAWQLSFEKWEWVAFLLCTGLVLSMELINSSIESLCDFVETEQNTAIGRIKDIAAGAVLLSSITASITGVILVLNHLD